MSLLLPAGGATVAANLECTYAGSAVNTGSVSSPITVSSVPIGAANAGRQVVVVCCMAADNGTSTITAATVGGVSATQVAVTADAGGRCTWMGIANVPSGTTGDVVITYSAYTSSTMWVGAYRCLNINTTATDTEVSQANPFVFTMSCVAGGVIIGGGMADQMTAWAWTNAAEVVDEQSESTNYCTLALDLESATVTDRTVTATPTGTAANRAGVMAAFQKA